MPDRRDPRFGVRLCALVVSAALLLAGGIASAQPPDPEGSAPSALPVVGQQEPPPGAEQPGGAPPPPPGTAAPPPGTAVPPPGTAAPPPGTAAPPPGPPPPPPHGRPRGPLRARELRLNIGIGAAAFVFGDEVVGNGPAFTLAAHWVRWWGPFLLGGGPSVYYSYMTETKEPKDYIHQLTLNAETLVGGGIYGRFAVFAHLVLGAGVAKAWDAETREHLTIFWIRAVAGLGGWVQLGRFLSVGVVVDLGWPGTVDALATLGFHFGRRW